MLDCIWTHIRDEAFKMLCDFEGWESDATTTSSSSSSISFSIEWR